MLRLVRTLRVRRGGPRRQARTLSESVLALQMGSEGKGRVGRAIFAFLALPGVVAYVVPVLIAPADIANTVWQWPGVTLITAGSALLLWCVREFYVTGKGTLAPWSPPRELVMTGPYRWSRNPMYVSVLLVVLGWVLFYRSAVLLAYLASLAVAFQLRIVLYEEPRLSAGFGGAWVHYRAEVGRWFVRGR